MSWINPKLKAGERRKVITGIPGKTGVVYTLDRQTGEFLWATPTVSQNVISRIDGHRRGHRESGDAVHRRGPGAPDLPRHQRRQELAGRRLQSADQHDVFPAAEHACMAATSTDDKPSLRSLYGLTMKGRIAPGTDKVGTV